MGTFMTMADRASRVWFQWMWPMAWQLALMGLVVLGVALLARKASPRFRNFLWCLVLLKLCLPPSLAFVTGVGQWVLPKQAAAVPLVASDSAVTAARSAGGGTAPFLPSPMSGSELVASAPHTATVPTSRAAFHVSWVTVLFGTWCLGAGVLVFLFLMQRRRMGRLLAAAEPFEGEVALRLLEEAKAALGVSSRVGLLSVEELHSPILFGAFRPRIAIPRQALESLPSDQVRPILLHELTHLRRKDLWVSFIQMLLQILYWFHPVVWMANRQLRQERELIVDDIVLTKLYGHRESYSASLLSIARQGARWQFVMPAYVGIVETQGTLTHRLKRIMDVRRKISLRLGWAGLVVLVALGLVLIPQARSQNAPGRPPESTAPAPAERPKDQPAQSVNKRCFVQIVIGKDKMTFEGEDTTWEALAKLLEKVPNRQQTVLQLAMASDQMTVGEFFEAQARASDLARRFGFEYLSNNGVHPLGSKGSAPREVAAVSEAALSLRQYDVSDLDADAEMLVKVLWEFTGRENWDCVAVSKDGHTRYIKGTAESFKGTRGPGRVLYVRGLWLMVNHVEAVHRKIEEMLAALRTDMVEGPALLKGRPTAPGPAEQPKETGSSVPATSTATEFPQKETTGPSGRRPTGNCAISGKVISAVTGEPVPKARVYLFYKPTLDALFIDAASNGWFEFKDIPAGEYTLRVINTAGYQDKEYDPEKRGGRWGRLADFALKQNEQRNGIVFKLDPAFRISGRILDEQGEPLPETEGFAVLAWAPETGTDSPGVRYRIAKQTQRIGKDGSYLLDGLDGHPVYVMAIDFDACEKDDAYPPCYYPGTFSRDEARKLSFDKGSSVENVDIHLRKKGGLTLEGIVSDESTGKPIPKVLITVHRKDMLFDLVAAYTDDQGYYRVQCLGTGEFLVQVDATPQGFVRTRRGISLGGSLEANKLSFSLKRGVTISGKFVDAEGKQLEIAGGNTFGSASVRDLNEPHSSFVLTGWRNRYGPHVVGPSEGETFLPDDGDYGIGNMVFPTASSFLISGMAPGKIFLSFNPATKGKKVLKILYHGADVLKEGIQAKVGDALEGIEIVIGDEGEKTTAKPPVSPS
jgi:beta-lactamase regulating signal transducer with metallopeptidase domain